MAMRQLSAIGLAALVATLAYATAVPSADTKSSSKRGGTAKSAPATEAGDSSSDSNNAPAEIVIHRRRIHLRAPEKYQVPMHLDPVRTVRLAAPFDGTVKSILHKPGEHLESAAEVIRMDMTVNELRRDRAKALYQVAKLEDEQASGNAKPLDDARLQAAKAELDLAVYWVEQGALRAPFSCEVLRVDVSEGQIVRMGEPLAIRGRHDGPRGRDAGRPQCHEGRAADGDQGRRPHGPCHGRRDSAACSAVRGPARFGPVSGVGGPGRSEYRWPLAGGTDRVLSVCSARRCGRRAQQLHYELAGRKS